MWAPGAPWTWPEAGAPGRLGATTDQSYTRCPGHKLDEEQSQEPERFIISCPSYEDISKSHLDGHLSARFLGNLVAFSLLRLFLTLGCWHMVALSVRYLVFKGKEMSEKHLNTACFTSLKFPYMKDRNIDEEGSLMFFSPSVMMYTSSAVMTVTHSNTISQTFSVASLPTSLPPPTSASFVNDQKYSNFTINSNRVKKSFLYFGNITVLWSWFSLLH